MFFVLFLFLLLNSCYFSVYARAPCNWHKQVIWYWLDILLLGLKISCLLRLQENCSCTWEVNLRVGLWSIDYTSLSTMIHQYFILVLSCYKIAHHLSFKITIKIRVVISAQEKVFKDEEIITTAYSHGSFSRKLSVACIKYWTRAWYSFSALLSS